MQHRRFQVTIGLLPIGSNGGDFKGLRGAGRRKIFEKFLSGVLTAARAIR